MMNLCGILKILPICTFAFLHSMEIHAQVTGHATWDHVINVLRSDKNDLYRETVYCHLSHSDLLTGETLYFKGHCLQLSGLEVSPLSNTLYCEVLDRSGRAVIQQMIPLDHGHGAGAMYLPSTLSSDYYVFRAYTRWMKNVGAGSFFTRIIRVVNPFKPLGAGAPETGIAKRPNTSALRGSASISIDIEDPAQSVTLQCELPNPSGKNTPRLCMLFNNLRLLRHREVHTGDGHFAWTFGKLPLRAGLVHALVLDTAGKVECLESVRYMTGKAPQIKIETDQSTYTPRSPVAVHVRVEGTVPNLHESSISVAVVSQPAGWNRPCEDIQNTLLDKPGLYRSRKHRMPFADSTGFAPGATPLLVNLEDPQETLAKILLRPDTIEHLPDYRQHLIRGTAYSRLTGNAMPYQTVYLSVPSPFPATYVCKSDRLGHLEFETKTLYGTNQIVVMPEDTIADIEISIEHPFAVGQPYDLPTFQLSDSLRGTLERQSIAMQVRNAYRTVDTGEVEVELLHRDPFYHRADEIYDLDDYTRFPVMEEVFREYIRGVLVRKRQGRFILKVIDPLRNSVFERPPIILLDGVPVLDAHKIMQMDPLEIKTIEVVTREYYYGDKTFHGIVSLHTYGGDLSGYTLNPRAGIKRYATYPLPARFVMPDYQRNRKMPEADFRTLLYWHPCLEKTLDEKAGFVFYTSDLEGSYRIDLQGITSDGVPFSASKTIRVQAHSR